MSINQDGLCCPVEAYRKEAMSSNGRDPSRACVFISPEVVLSVAHLTMRKDLPLDEVVSHMDEGF